MNKNNISLKGIKQFSDFICKFVEKINILNMKSSIRLNKMKFYAFHGVMEQEQKVGNTFIVDLKLDVDLSKASETDDLSDTINYAEIYSIIKAEMEIPSKLLEHVAGRILQRIKTGFPIIEKIKICLAKERPPMGGEIESAAVILGTR